MLIWNTTACKAYWNSYTGTRQLMKFSVFSSLSISESVHLVCHPSHHKNKCKDKWIILITSQQYEHDKAEWLCQTNSAECHRSVPACPEFFGVTTILNFSKMFSMRTISEEEVKYILWLCWPIFMQFCSLHSGSLQRTANNKVDDSIWRSVK